MRRYSRVEPPPFLAFTVLKSASDLDDWLKLLFLALYFVQVIRQRPIYPAFLNIGLFLYVNKVLNFHVLRYLL